MLPARTAALRGQSGPSQSSGGSGVLRRWRLSLRKARCCSRGLVSFESNGCVMSNKDGLDRMGLEVSSSCRLSELSDLSDEGEYTSMLASGLACTVCQASWRCQRSPSCPSDDL